jgi:hypothetical protein
VHHVNVHTLGRLICTLNVNPTLHQDEETRAAPLAAAAAAAAAHAATPPAPPPTISTAISASSAEGCANGGGGGGAIANAGLVLAGAASYGGVPAYRLNAYVYTAPLVSAASSYNAKRWLLDVDDDD